MRQTVRPRGRHGNLEVIFSRPDKFGHHFTFHKPGPDGKRHECPWCRWEREWQAELEAVRQRVREEIEREKRQVGWSGAYGGRDEANRS